MVDAGVAHGGREEEDGRGEGADPHLELPSPFTEALRRVTQEDVRRSRTRLHQRVLEALNLTPTSPCPLLPFPRPQRSPSPLTATRFSSMPSPVTAAGSCSTRSPRSVPSSPPLPPSPSLILLPETARQARHLHRLGPSLEPHRHLRARPQRLRLDALHLPRDRSPSLGAYARPSPPQPLRHVRPLVPQRGEVCRGERCEGDQCVPI